MSRTFTYSALIFLSALFIAPFLWTLITAVKSDAELVAYPPVFWPETWHWENFAIAWTKHPFNIFLQNSVIIVILSTIGQLFSSSLVAYGFARFRFPGRDAIFILLLATMMIPWDVKMIPLYMEFNYLGWINTLKPLIVPAWFGEAFFVFLQRQYIMTIPMEIDEAARMDGANAWQRFWHVTLPSLRSVFLIILVLRTVDTFRVFDIIYQITQGGPAGGTTVLAYQAYLASFLQLQFGQGAAVSFVIAAAIVTLAAIYVRLLNKGERP